MRTDGPFRFEPAAPASQRSRTRHEFENRLLNAVGLPELVAHNLVDYEALAFRLSQNFVGNIESADRRMWDTCLSGAPPSARSV